MNARAKHTHRTRDEEEEKKNCIAFNLNYEMMSFLSESFTNAFAQYISYGTCSIGYGKRRIQWRKLRLVVKAKKIKISMKEKQKYKIDYLWSAHRHRYLYIILIADLKLMTDIS